MDLILLEPGDAQLVGLKSDNQDDESLSTSLGVDGASCIELISMNQGMKQQLTTDVSNSARTSGRPSITEITCVKYVDRSSVKFNELCLRAKPLGQGADQPTKIHLMRNSGAQITDDASANYFTFLTIQLRDALISEIQFQSHPNDMPTEQFKLSFTEILWEYNNSDSQKVENQLLSGWSLSKNRSIDKFTD